MKRFITMILILALSFAMTCASAAPEDMQGQILQDFSTETISGEAFMLSESLKTHDLVLINFWATWCGPCCYEFPFLETAWEQYADRVDVVALSVEEADTFDDLRSFASGYGLNFSIGRDETGMFERMGGTAIPTTLIVDKNRRVVAVETGAKSSPEEFAALFDSLFGVSRAEDANGAAEGTGQDTGTQAAPSSEEYPVGLDMTIEQFAAESDQLIRAAKTWTKETVPRSLDDFPLMPSPVSDVYERISHAGSLLMAEGDGFTWKTFIPELFADSRPDLVDAYMQYVTGEEYQYLSPQEAGTNSFLFRLPQDLSITDVETIGCDFRWNLPDGWTEILQISYEMENGKITDDLFVEILFSCDDRSVSWTPGFSAYDRFRKDRISIDIFSVSGYQADRIWYLDYDTGTGEIVRMADDRQVIEMN